MIARKKEIERERSQESTSNILSRSMLSPLSGMPRMNVDLSNQGAFDGKPAKDWANLNKSVACPKQLLKAFGQARMRDSCNLSVFSKGSDYNSTF